MPLDVSPALHSRHRKRVLSVVRSCGSYVQHDGGTILGRVCRAEPDSRNHLTGVTQHTTVSGLEKGAGSASVCGMSALCLSAP